MKDHPTNINVVAVETLATKPRHVRVKVTRKATASSTVPYLILTRHNVENKSSDKQRAQQDNTAAAESTDQN